MTSAVTHVINHWIFFHVALKLEEISEMNEIVLLLVGAVFVVLLKFSEEKYICVAAKTTFLFFIINQLLSL
jgi:hypothetical protein